MEEIKNSTSTGNETIVPKGESSKIRTYKLESSLIETAAYNKETNQLILKFKNSPEFYIYDNFPVIMFGEFMAAKSYGTFFHKIIKGSYLFNKSTPIEEQ